MRAIQVSCPKGPLELVEREIPQPGPGEVRIRVQACGICHSDAFTKDGTWPGLQYPRVPGHEVAGVVDAIGERVTSLQPGQRAGVGWHGGHCFRCERCRRGDFNTCVNARFPGISYDGGYADFVVVPEEAVVRIPDGMTALDAGPLMCAGITTFNALRNSGARPGDLVAVLGIGGLGHLGIQFARKMGFRTIAIARGQGKQALAHELGAHHYIDSEATDVATELNRLGGARVVLATATSATAVSAALGGLGVNGKLVTVGVAADPLQVHPVPLILGRRSVQGWPAGHPTDTEDTLSFSLLSGVRSLNEIYPLERAAEAYERMTSGKARFRVVLSTGNH